MIPLRSFASRAALAGATLAVSLAPTAAAAQRLGQGGGAEVSWWRVAAALLLCLGLAFGAAIALRRRWRGGGPLFTQGPRRLELVESLRLGHQNDICIVRCDDRNIILAATPQGVTLIEANLPALHDSRPR